MSPREALKDAFTFRHCGPDIAVRNLVRLRKIRQSRAEISSSQSWRMGKKITRYYLLQLLTIIGNILITMNILMMILAQ